MSRVLVIIIRGYQALTRGGTPRCRYVPSCSNYAIEALQRYGAVKGTFLAVKRILRCHPWGGSGYDPVP
ncbi:MAG: membrane protein insertion efficiency factor YidD [Candidatus Saccharibacteria bacterium]